MKFSEYYGESHNRHIRNPLFYPIALNIPENLIMLEGSKKSNAKLFELKLRSQMRNVPRGKMEKLLEVSSSIIWNYIFLIQSKVGIWKLTLQKLFFVNVDNPSRTPCFERLSTVFLICGTNTRHTFYWLNYWHNLDNKCHKRFYI